VFAPAYRRQGVAGRLLDAACDGLRGLGMTTVEAHPRAGAASDARAYHGPLSMYLNAGFELAHEHEGATVVNRAL
jgi:GNAT superfamily N-acetyltransferase